MPFSQKTLFIFFSIAIFFVLLKFPQGVFAGSASCTDFGFPNLSWYCTGNLQCNNGGNGSCSSVWCDTDEASTACSPGSFPISEGGCYTQCGGGGGGNTCDTGSNVPVWLRIYSNENGQITSWKPSIDPVLGTNWSVPESQGGGLDANGNFKSYKPAYDNFFTNGFQTLNWSTVSNKLSSTMRVDLRMSTNVHTDLIKTPKNWSTHFCSGGIARTENLSKRTVNDLGECSGPRTFTCSDINNGCSTDNNRWYRYCRGDYDGCSSQLFRLGIQPPNESNAITEHGVYLANMLGDANGEVPLGVNDFSGKWSLSYAVRDDCESMTTKFTLTPPLGYKCKSVNVKGHSQLVGAVSEGLTNSTQFLKNNDNTCSVEFNPKSGGNLVFLELEKLDPPPSSQITLPGVASTPNIVPDIKVCQGETVSFSYNANYSSNLGAFYFVYSPTTNSNWSTINTVNNINYPSYSGNYNLTFSGPNFTRNSDYYVATGITADSPILDKYTRCSGNPFSDYSSLTTFAYCGNQNFESNPQIDNSANRPWRKIHIVDDADTPVITDISPDNFATKLKIEYTTSNTDTLGLILYRKLATEPDSSYVVFDSFDSTSMYSSYLKYYSSGTQTSVDGKAKYTCTGTIPNVTCTVEYTDANVSCNGINYSYRAKLVVGYVNPSLTTYTHCPYSAFSNVLTNVSCSPAPNQAPILTVEGYRYYITTPIPLSAGYRVNPFLGIKLHYNTTDAENDTTVLTPSVNFGNLYNNTESLAPAPANLTFTPPNLSVYRWLPNISFSSVVNNVGWIVNNINITQNPNTLFLLNASGIVRNYAPSASTTSFFASYNQNLTFSEPSATVRFVAVKDLGTSISNNYLSNCLNSSTFNSLPAVNADHKKPSISLTYNSYSPISSLQLESTEVIRTVTALPDLNTKYTANLTLPINSSDQYEVKCVNIIDSNSIYSGQASSFSISFENSKTYYVRVVVGKASTESWMQSEGSSIGSNSYTGSYSNFPSGEFLLKNGTYSNAGVFYTKSNITGSNFTSDNFAVNNNYFYINNSHVANINDYLTKNYLSSSNFFTDYKLNYSTCTSTNSVSGNINNNRCYTPSSGNTLTINSVTVGGSNFRNIYFDSQNVVISNNITKTGPDESKNLPMFVIKGDLVINPNVTLIEGVFLVGGTVTFATEGSLQSDTPLALKGAILSKNDIILRRDGLYNLSSQNNILPIVRTTFLPRFLLEYNRNFLKESAVIFFKYD